MLDEDGLVRCLQSSNPLPLLKEFSNDALANPSDFPALKAGREFVWSSIFKKIQSEPDILYYLKTLRVLSRDKEGIEEFVTEERVAVLFRCAGFGENNYNVDCVVEALKCMCNLMLNYNKTAQYLEDLNTVKYAVKRINSKDTVNEEKIYDIKLLFLITALNRSARLKAFQEARGLNLFTNLLKEESNFTNMTEERVKFCCDIIKLMFNVLIEIEPDKPNTRCDASEILKLTTVLKDLLSCNLEYAKRLHNDVINLLTVIPKIDLLVLIAPGQGSSEPDFSTLDNIINHMDILLTELESNPKIPKDTLSPILLVLFRLAELHNLSRKYMRFKILPKLTDVSTRPEEGKTIRNKLCRLLTCPVQCISDLVADFLFVLCKENVARMVKHTGFGNAAGLLARRGLLGAPGDYSSDSEDSETEEYSRDKHLINPIIGCKDEPRVNILDSMPYEQKEFLAMELVNKIDQLQRGGIIQPCRIVDGRPEPIESLQELQLAMKPNENNEDSS
ncbi:synembryn-A [Cimex lectularius]|uniref:Synembryn n=1 Tax=Cimex lectularius TaxID=79782 RepID=A0A8I6TDI3_CIMLE|nr:synembryn-A [Cimex lectularius]